MKSPTLAAALLVATLAGPPASACGDASALSGTLSIPSCDKTTDSSCVPAPGLVYAYLEVLDIPGVYTIGLQTSPWRMYDAQDRIIPVAELAALVEEQRTDHTRVHLIGSWTARQPGGEGETLARQLSAALGGFPVDGTDGFLWLTAEGGMRTTHQAYSVWKTGPYHLREGDDVMVAFVPGSLAQFENDFAADGLAEGVVRAGVGHDAFRLCPEAALAAFERAAAMGSAIGAWNAALMHEQDGDLQATRAWLDKAVQLGDEKARARRAAMAPDP